MIDTYFGDGLPTCILNNPRYTVGFVLFFPSAHVSLPLLSSTSSLLYLTLYWQFPLLPLLYSYVNNIFDMD